MDNKKNKLNDVLVWFVGGRGEWNLFIYVYNLYANGRGGWLFFYYTFMGLELCGAPVACTRSVKTI